MFGNIAAVPGAVFDGARRRHGGFQLSEEPRALVSERLSEAHDPVGPLLKTGELPADVHRVAEPGRRGVESCQPLPSPLGGRDALVGGAVQETLLRRRSLDFLFQQDSHRGQIDERLGNGEFRLRAEAGPPDGLHGSKYACPIDVVHFADHAVPSGFGFHGDLERAAFPMPFEWLSANRLQRTPVPLGDAQPIEL